jgi:hypothetical protein
VNRLADIEVAMHPAEAMLQCAEVLGEEPSNPLPMLDSFSDFAFALAITKLSVELVAATLQLHLEMAEGAAFANDATLPSTPAPRDSGDTT